MKIVIFGSNGLLGSELKKTFADLSPYSFDKSVVDITNQTAVSAILAQLEPHVVINAAAYTDVDKAEEEPQKAMLVNAEGVKNIAECAKENNSIVLHYSTDYIFNGSDKSGFNEDDIPKTSEPVNVYGRSKLQGEKNLRSITTRHYIIRTSWLFGGGKHDFTDFVVDSLSEGKVIKAVEDQFSKPTYVKDLAQATRVLLSEAGEDLPFGTYHVVNEGIASRLDQAEKIVEFYGKKQSWEKSDYPSIQPIKMSDLDQVAKRPAYSILNNNKFIKMRPWQEALEEYVINPPKQGTSLA